MFLKLNHVSELGVTCWVCCVCVGGCPTFGILLTQCASFNRVYVFVVPSVPHLYVFPTISISNIYVSNVTKMLVAMECLNMVWLILAII